MATLEEMKNGADLLRQRPAAPPAPPTVSRIETISRRLREGRPKALAMPEYQEVFENKGVSDVVAQIIAITSEYDEGFESRISRVNDDLMKLASLYTNLAMHVGAVQGFAYHAEQSLKVCSAQLYGDALSFAETSGMKLTNNEATSMTRVLTREQREMTASHETASKVLLNYMFSVKAFIETLVFVKGSSDRELMRGL